MTTQTAIEPVRRTITVDCSPEHAFTTFTERIGDWWPLDAYSISHGEGMLPRTAVFEREVGGRVYEVSPSGEELSWAEILVWEPPSRVVLAWNPSREERPRTEIDVRFAAEGDGTRVDLEHRGWERLGALATEARAGYAAGWQAVLGRYADAASG